MTVTLLLLLLVLLWFLLRPKRDWYVVEWRPCSDEKLYSTAFSSPADFGFDKLSLSAHDLVIENKSSTGATILHKDGGRIKISQTVFDDMGAALQYFEKTKELFPVVEDFQKVYIWRIVARSRKSALVLPPKKYIANEGIELQAFPPHLWFKPQKDD